MAISQSWVLEVPEKLQMVKNIEKRTVCLIHLIKSYQFLYRINLPVKQHMKKQNFFVISVINE